MGAIKTCFDYRDRQWPCKYPMYIHVAHVAMVSRGDRTRLNEAL